MWVPITLAATTFQILRTSRQHQLRSALSTAAAGFIRYLYGAPLALGLSAVLFGALGHRVPSIPGHFWPVVAGAGIAQILATVALLQAFKVRDFAIGTAYSKAEVILVAVVGAIGLGEPLQPLGWVGALLVTAGVAWLAARGSIASVVQRAGDPAALLGLVAGGFFALASVGIRGASNSLGDAPAFDRAVLTLTAMLVVQTFVNTAWFLVRDPAEIRRTVSAWRPAVPVGVLSLLGSVAWAWAMTLENAAKVRTLGQVELVIAFLIARISLGERHGRRDLVASGVVLVGVLVVTLYG
ncbi:MAG: EamA family transporter [Acidimicrobiia bacterium]|nr:EamA family transporter [Acidimicrobiia bacterium]